MGFVKLELPEHIVLQVLLDKNSMVEEVVDLVVVVVAVAHAQEIYIVIVQ